MSTVQDVILAPLGLAGSVVHPAAAKGIVLFAHGSGSSRLSPRNTYVARALQRAGLATLLFDLLTEAEAIDRRNVFDIDLLASRLEAATSWLADQPDLHELAVGYFGASTGAAAALTAAAHRPEITAIVSRGGRPDMAAPLLSQVRAPTLLIVGGHDHQVLELNRLAYDRLTCEKELAVVPGATHLFEEPGTLDQVIEQAEAWFLRFLGAEPSDRS